MLQNQQGLFYKGREHRQPAADSDSEDDVVFENIFANHGHEQRPHMKREDRRNETDNSHFNRWELGFKLEEFPRTLNPEEFIDWLKIVEEIFDFKQIPQEMRVHLVATHFKNRAMVWWQQFKESRRKANKPRVDTWEQLKKHVRRSFLPYNYERTLYNKLQNL